MEKRHCGDCTACCKTHGILELWKMAGKWCQHCDIGKGCRIYDTRPRECREFKCAWLLGLDGSGPQHRPDKTKIVPEYREIEGIGMLMWFWELREGALSSNFTRNWSRRNLLLGNCVMHVSLTLDHKLYLSKRVNYSHRFLVLGPFHEKVDIIQFPESLSCFV